MACKEFCDTLHQYFRTSVTVDRAAGEPGLRAPLFFSFVSGVLNIMVAGVN